MMKKTVLWLTVGVVLVWTGVGQGAFRICCGESNDLYRVMRKSGVACVRYATGAEAVAAAEAGEGVLVLAGGYPQTLTAIDSGAYEAAAAKGVRLYVEYPSVVPGLELGEPKNFRTGPYGVRYDRTVVSSDAFGRKLPRLSITAIHDCRFVPVAVEQTHMVLARVVGFDKASLGLPKDVFPILFEHPEGEVMVATTSLSNFVTGRYAPTEAWGQVWGMILSWLQGGRPVAELTWTPMVRPSYGRAEVLPGDAELQAVRRTADWYLNSRLLVHESWQPQRLPTGVKDPIPANWGVGDGAMGISEAFDDRILYDGSQAVARDVRADCNNESAMLLSAATVLFGNETYEQTAKNLNDYILFESILCNGPRGDEASPSYGILGWAMSVEGGKENMYWGGDNARCLLAIMGSAALLKTDRWDEVVVRGVLANFRTTGPLGFRDGMLHESGIARHGWQHYWETKRVTYSPLQECHLWATYLWLYDKTGYEPLLARAKAGIYRMMEAYPEKWAAECGRMEPERAHMLLPLAWLVRVEDTPLHREWLDWMVKYLQVVQHASGAIPQYVDVPYTSNEQYGTGEAPIVYETGDPATDMLYTMNFALIGMHEAFAATGNLEYKQVEDRMADFLIRIQTRCERRPELDGCWYRIFDYAKWDYWGSDGDLGWGVWAAETGWTQPWVAGTMALRQMKTSLWDLTKSSKAGGCFEKYRKLMLPAEIIEEGPGKADVPTIEDGYGIDKSSISRHWKAARAKQLQTLLERLLGNLDIVVIMLDGKAFHDYTLITALGVDSEDRKHVLGLCAGATEDAQVCGALLDELIERGLPTNRRYLFVLDGSKALKAAWGLADYAEARRQMEKVHDWLATINISAAACLEEEVKETLTVTRLNLPAQLCKLFDNTNLIESAFSLTDDLCRNVKPWRSGNMAQRWAGVVLLEAEQRFHRIKGYRSMPQLNALKRILDTEQEVA